MNYVQVRNPNLSTTDIPGWCLRLVLHAFGFNGGADFARAEWNRNTTKHTDALPSDVCVPVFYSWHGTIDNITQDWGDVAIYVPNRGVFGSPMRGQTGNSWFPSVEARRVAIGGGAQYLGWTESLNGTQLIQPAGGKGAGDDMVQPSEADVYSAFNQFAGKAPANPEQVQYYMARDIRELYHDLMFYEIIPKKETVQDAFKRFSPTPIDAPPYTDQTTYYSQRPAGVLYSDLALGLAKILADLRIKDEGVAQQLKALQDQSVSDTAAGDSFLRRVGQFFKKYLP